MGKQYNFKICIESCFPENFFQTNHQRTILFSALNAKPFFSTKNNDIVTNQFVTAVDSQLLLKNTSKSKVANRAYVAI